jgi:DNA-3-methyladenine glycosylase II
MLTRAIKRAQIFNHPNMPVTRSASGRSAKTVSKPASVAVKRKDSESSAPRAKKPRNVGIDASAINQTGAIESSIPNEGAVEASSNVLPAKLSFSFEEAKRHLINTDNRFQDLFNKMTCKPFEHLEQVHPFR